MKTWSAGSMTSLAKCPRPRSRKPSPTHLGAIDVDRFKAKYGQVPDEGTRDDPTMLSLFFPPFRINELGAWCLGQNQHYQPEEVVARKTWRVLPNHDVVSSELNPNPVDVMFLDKVADRTSDLVWRLDREKTLTAVENGLAIEAITKFLEQRSSEPIPQTVETLLDDLLARATRLRDKGTVRMIECSDAETARLLLLDPKLSTLCLAAGARNLVFRAADETKVRTQLRKLGISCPPASEMGVSHGNFREINR